MRILILAISIFSLLSHPAHAANRADLLAYVDREPTRTLSGSTFFSWPLKSCLRHQDPSVCQTSANTYIDYQEVSALAHPSGATAWGMATVGKYVLLGNYDAGGTGLSFDPNAPITIEDQQVGVFDSESETFCILDLDPSAKTLAGVQTLSVAEPDSRETRVYFQGFPADNANNPAAFGFIDVDIDNPDPCNPTTGWAITRFTAAQINTASSDPQSDIPCPGSPAFCGFDGMEILHHDENSGVDTVAINNWWAQSVMVAEIDSLGALDVVDVLPLPHWKPAQASGACFDLFPVSQPASDRTRPASDLRFASEMDVFCTVPDGTPGCTNWTSLCPASGSGCDECDNGSCSVTAATCQTNADCSACSTGLCTVDGSSCSVNADCVSGTCDLNCVLVHPGQKCAESGDVCFRNDNCDADEACVCAPGSPVQEFSFDGTTLSFASAHFQSGSTARTKLLNMFDSEGNLWTTKNPLDPINDPNGDGSQLGIYAVSGSGEHSYYTTTNGTGSEIHTPESLVDFERLYIFGQPVRSVEVGDYVYTVGLQNIERAQQDSTGWIRDDEYEMYVGGDTLGNDPRQCWGGTNDGNSCRFDVDCPDAGSQDPGVCKLITNRLAGEIWKSDLVLGGVPSSLWVAPRYNFSPRDLATSPWLVKIPVESPIPSTESTTKPAAVWSSDSSCSATCDRLWLFGETNGNPKFKIRDDGFWSSWHALPTNMTIENGIAAVFYDGNVEIFARTSTGQLVTSSLTSSLGCSVGSCTWASWSTITSAPQVAGAPAAAVQDFGSNQGPVVVVRRADNGRLAYSRRNSGTWANWKNAGTLVKPDMEHTVFSNPDDLNGRMWIVATRPSNDTIYYGRVTSSLGWGQWKALPGAPSGVTWGSGPQAVFDGQSARIFANQTSSPEITWQTYHESGTFDADWKPIASRGVSTQQPAAVVHDGKIELLTINHTGSISEQMVQ